MATAYQPYLGKKVSEADLTAMAAAVSDVYRAAGFHLSRAIIPPQDVADDRKLRLQVIEGSITEVALKGEGAEQLPAFGRCSTPSSPSGPRFLQPSNGNLAA